MNDFDVRATSELSVIDSLLRSKAFTLKVAGQLDSAYYAGIGALPPAKQVEDTGVFEISERDEMIATNIASFYALECGINFIVARSGKKITQLLDNLLAGSTDTPEILILNRFANATWKAGQPFRSLDRIERPIFRVANFLSPEEVAKDYRQVLIPASLLSKAMAPVAASAGEAQMDQLRKLLQDPSFAFEVASLVDSSYSGNGPMNHLATDSADDPAHDRVKSYSSTTMVSKKLADQKTATSVAGFYALECAISYLVTTQRKLPSELINALVQKTADPATLDVFARFANATWKAGQPFRGLSRITRRTFTPFNLLTKEDIDKDLQQVTTAAQLLSPYLLK